MSPRDQLVPRLVEADVTVAADTEDLEIDSAGPADRLLVAIAFGIEIRGGTVQKVDPRRDRCSPRQTSGAA
jgi:hypothetical protein